MDSQELQNAIGSFLSASVPAFSDGPAVENTMCVGYRHMFLVICLFGVWFTNAVCEANNIYLLPYLQCILFVAHYPRFSSARLVSRPTVDHGGDVHRYR